MVVHLAPDGLRAIHALPIADVYRLLATSAQGLSHTEAAQRLQQYGHNRIREAKGPSLLLKCLANFTHLMALLLWLGGAIAMFAHLPQLGLAIWLVNLLNGAFSFWQEFKAEKATAALRRLLPISANVRRAGEVRPIAAEDLVPGDILVLTEGVRISADCRLIDASELYVDQSTLTGEAHVVHKTAEVLPHTDLPHTDLPNLVFAGTHVAAGAGEAVVWATGMQTAFGQIAHLTQSVGEGLSPLQQEIMHVTKVVSVVAMGVGLCVFALATLLGSMRPAEGFIFALGMIVAFVPEGLLPTVTLALAMGVQRMARRHALVKRLSAVETLGCTTVICTDKTGTLTQNEMTVRALWVGGTSLTVTGSGYTPVGQILDQGQPVAEAQDSDLLLLLRAAALCNNAQLLPPTREAPHWTVHGDPTEAALLVLAHKGGCDVASAQRRFPRRHALPFESRRRRMSTIHDVGPHRMAYVKGDPHELLHLCDTVLVYGQDQHLDDELRRQATQTTDRFARSGLRVLAVAQRVLPDHMSDLRPASIECHLTLLGLVAMLDPPRPEVAPAVETCHRAGIRVIMMTGDYGLTAESIARRIGIVGVATPRVITGTELEGMSQPLLKEALRHDVLFARVAPGHKLRIVRALQELGHVVAVTGDGVNDAPALKQADIGVAMGTSGTDVAREAAEIILTDDNFASIVSAVEEGRTVYANIKKFTSYIFTSNTPEAVPFILFAFSGGRIPLALNVMQILAVDLGTDIVPALALGAEPSEPGVMDRPPRNRTDHVITRALLTRAYVWLGPLQSCATMAAFYFFYWIYGPHQGQWLDLPASGALYQGASTMALAMIVTTQIGNLFAHRGEHLSIWRLGWFTNRLVWPGIATELLLIGLIVYAPGLQWVFGTVAVPVDAWLFLFAWAPVLLIVDEVHKALRRRQPPTRTV